MNRDQFLRKLRKYAKKHKKDYSIDEKKGKGSHYIVYYSSLETTIQHDLNPERIQRILRQLGIDDSDFFK